MSKSEIKIKYLLLGKLSLLSEYKYISVRYPFQAFLIRAGFKSMQVFIEHFLEKHDFIILNLGAAFLCEKYPNEMTYLFKNSNMVFGNEYVRINNQTTTTNKTSHFFRNSLRSPKYSTSKRQT